MKSKDIHSSQLRHVVDIISYSSGVDEDGIPVDNQEIITTVRARVDTPSLKRQETLISRGINISKSLMFIIRYISDFDSETHKIRFKNRIYEVEGVENVEERDLYLNILGEVKK